MPKIVQELQKADRMEREAQQEELKKQDKDRRSKDFDADMIYQSNKKVARMNGQTPGWDIDAQSKVEDRTGPSFLPSIITNDNQVTPGVEQKKKKPVPKIYDLTEQLKALEEEKERLQQEKATIMSQAESKSSYSRAGRRGKKKGKKKAKAPSLFYPESQHEYIVANGAEDDLVSPMPTIFEVDREKPAATVVRFDQNEADAGSQNGSGDWSKRQQAAVARQQELLNNIRKQ